MQRANQTQVGGDHYKTVYEHWDWALDVGMGIGYLTACATKYVARHKKKNGLQDLEKALHYTVKIIEVIKRDGYIVGDSKATVNTHLTTEQFALLNDLDPLEHEYCAVMASFTSVDDLLKAKAIVQTLIIQTQDRQRLKAVPLEDSNKHAERQHEGITFPNAPGQANN